MITVLTIVLSLVASVLVFGLLAIGAVVGAEFRAAQRDHESRRPRPFRPRPSNAHTRLRDAVPIEIMPTPSGRAA